MGDQGQGDVPPIGHTIEPVGDDLGIGIGAHPERHGRVSPQLAGPGRTRAMAHTVAGHASPCRPDEHPCDGHPHSGGTPARGFRRGRIAYQAIQRPSATSILYCTSFVCLSIPTACMLACLIAHALPRCGADPGRPAPHPPIGLPPPGSRRQRRGRWSGPREGYLHRRRQRSRHGTDASWS